jgi:hypothetical protein
VFVPEEGRQSSALDPPIKAPRESPIRSAEVEAAVQARLLRRVVAEIVRVFQLEVRRPDPFKLLSYCKGAGDFRVHRDNDAPDVASCRFAISVNLDVEAHRGQRIQVSGIRPAPLLPRERAMRSSFRVRCTRCSPQRKASVTPCHVHSVSAV